MWKIERGVNDLSELIAQRELNQNLMIDQSMGEAVSQILDSGSCDVLENLEARINQIADIYIDTEIQTSPDEFV